MRKHGTTIILLLILFIGLSLMLYPTFSNWWNSMHQTRAIAAYSEQVAQLDTFANRLSSLVETLKERDTFRQEYSAVNLHDRDLIRMAKKEGVLEGIEQGQAQAKLESAITAVKFFNVTPQIAAEKMGVPLEELQKALKES